MYGWFSNVDLRHDVTVSDREIHSFSSEVNGEELLHLMEFWISK